MTWNPNIASNDIPRLSRSVLNTNFSRLETMFGAGHQFNNSADSTDGYHVVAKWLPSTDASVTTGTSIQTFANTINATLGPHLFTRASNASGQDGFNAPLTKHGSNGGITLNGSTPVVLFDVGNLTYVHGILSLYAPLKSGGFPTQQSSVWSFGRDSTSPGAAMQRMTTDTSLNRISIQWSGTTVTAFGFITSTETVYWAVDFYGMSPLA